MNKINLIRIVMQLSVIIVSYNVKCFLEQCLHAVIKGCKQTDAEIIVVDNASADGSVEYLKSIFTRVEFIINEVNSGFSKANNKALHIAKGEYILYLNPDVIVGEETIKNCLSFIQHKKNAGATGVKMIDGSGKFLPESKRAFPSVAASFFKLSGMAYLFRGSSVFNKYALGNLKEDEVHEADILSGAFLLCKKNILNALNGFDEDFFMYGEDIDLSYRIKKTGYKNYYLGDNTIIHFKGKSTQANASVHTKNFYGAMKVFVSKHYTHPSFFFLKPAITAASIIALLKEKFKSVFISAKKKKKTENFLLAGDEEAVESAAGILSANNHTYKKTALVTGTETMVNKIKPNLVFCIDQLTYEAGIEFIQTNKNRFTFYWHYKNSGSIITGSKTAAISQIYVTI